MMNFIKILLQFGSCQIHFMKIQFSFTILRKIAENSVHYSQNFNIPLLKNIINIVKFYIPFVT